MGDERDDPTVVHISNWIAAQNAAGRLVGSQRATTLLTDEERDVLQMVADGSTTIEVAEAVDLAPDTVKVTLERAIAKLQRH
jgi:DNA-binding CsgD family transcriptional regulator